MLVSIAFLLSDLVGRRTATQVAVLPLSLAVGTFAGCQLGKVVFTRAQNWYWGYGPQLALGPLIYGIISGAASSMILFHLTQVQLCGIANKLIDRL
jgi:hypothetical protein